MGAIYVVHMKKGMVDQIKELYKLTLRYASLRWDMLRMGTAEKMTRLMGAFIMAFVGVVLGALFIILLAFAAVAAFEDIVSPALAYVCVAGCVVLLFVLLWALRKPLLINPLSKVITSIIYPRKDEES